MPASPEPATSHAVRYAFCSFACILGCYFFLLPVREEAVLASGTGRLPALFLASLVATVAVAPVTSAVTAVQPYGTGHRRVLQAFAAVLIGLYVLGMSWPAAPITDPPTTSGSQEVSPPNSGGSRLNPHVSALLFVTVPLINVVAMSTMWSLCARCFTAEVATEKFGLLAAGATCGQLLGSAAALVFNPMFKRTAPGLLFPLLVSACLLLIASHCMAAVVTCTRPMQHPHAPMHPPAHAPLEEEDPKPHPTSQSGRPFSQLWRPSQLALHARRGRVMVRLHAASARKTAGLVVRSPYLLMVACHILLSAMASSLVYFERALVVTQSLKGSLSRLTFFAALNSCSAALILVLQLFATRHMMRHMGVGAAICATPALSILGFAIVAWHPTPHMVAGVEITRKMVMYSVGKPTREVLFTVLSIDELASKVVLDALVCRAGDSLAAGLFQLLEVRMHLGARALAVTGAALCCVWLLVALQLGAGYRRRLIAK